MALSTRAKVALEAIGCEDYVYQQGIPMFGRYVHNVDGKSYNIQPYGMNNEVRLTKYEIIQFINDQSCHIF